MRLSLALGLAIGLVGCSGTEPPDPAELIFSPKLSTNNYFTGYPALQQPAPGVLPYSVASTLYADGAGKYRFLVVPSGKQIHFDPTARWGFPDGTTIVKTFYYDLDGRDPKAGRRLIETRLLRYQGGNWYGVTYVWNDAQTDADRYLPGRAVHVDRLDETGQPAPIDYQVPSTSQCKSCHGQQKRIVPLGPRTRQMNRVRGDGGGSENQITWFQSLGLLDGAVPDPATLDQLADPQGKAPIEARARAYLDANCAHCHNEDGYASSTALRLEVETQVPIDLGVCRHPVAAGMASGGFLYDVEPGHPEQSILVYRMKSNDPKTKMPQLPLTTVDRFGTQLVSDWIAGLGGGPCR